MTQFVQSSVEGTTPAIPNSAASAELDTAILTDPVKIQAYKDAIASQMNAQSNGPTFEDLADRIADIAIETSAQGASVLRVSIIDPMWVLPMSGFISVDETGYLWPPIDVNFPAGTDCVWRLCQFHVTWDAQMTEANLTLTFEDRIASLLREMSPAIPGGIAQGAPNQTLGGFIKTLVDNTNSVLKLHGSDRIRLVELIDPQDPNYIPPITSLPANAEAPLRPNPTRVSQGVTLAQQKILDGITYVVNSLFSHKEQKRIQDAENLSAAKVAQLQQRGSQVWATPGSGAGNVP